MLAPRTYETRQVTPLPYTDIENVDEDNNSDNYDNEREIERKREREKEVIWKSIHT